VSDRDQQFGPRDSAPVRIADDDDLLIERCCIATP
jgi:hypothetical protein